MLKKSLAAAVSATTLTTFSQVSAGQTALEEVVVTAQKREQNLMDVPMSVYARTGADLNERGVSDLQTLALEVPGLYVADGGSYQRRVSIRGVGNIFGASSLVGIYLDEAPVTAIASSAIDLRVHDIARVEVLKGPQGTLYGQGSVGGTIRYITNDPQFDVSGGSLSADGYATKGGGFSTELRGVLNAPLVDDTLALRVVGQYVSDGGWIDQPELGKDDINDYDMFNVRSKLLWTPTDDLSIKATAIVHRNDAGAQNTGEDGSGNYQQALGDPTTPAAEDEYDFYDLTADYSFAGMTLLSTTSYLNNTKQVDNWGYACCLYDPDSDQLWNVEIVDYALEAEAFTQELRLSSDESDAVLYWTLGAFYRDTEFVETYQPYYLGLPGGIPGATLFEYPAFESVSKSRSWAVFGEASYDITEKLEVGAGFRYFEDEQEYQADRGLDYIDADFDSFNPKFFASYALGDEANIYVNASKGFRSGGTNGAGAPNYEPESLWSYELGAKARLMDGKLYTEVAVFYSDYSDYQIVGVDTSVGLNITSNAGDAEIKGVEATLVYNVLENLELGFSGNFMDTEFTKIGVTSTSHAVGDPLDLVPEYGYNLWADYQFNWTEYTDGFLRLNYNQQGEADFRNRSLSSPEYEYSSSSGVLNVLNARLGWRQQNWSTEIYANNLLNERGYLGPLSIEKNAARLRPRTFGIKLSYDF